MKLAKNIFCPFTWLVVNMSIRPRKSCLFTSTRGVDFYTTNGKKTLTLVIIIIGGTIPKLI